MNRAALVKVIDALLMDEQGISEYAFNQLLDLLSPQDFELEREIVVGHADATDGRFYFPEDFIGLESTIAQGF